MQIVDGWSRAVEMARTICVRCQRSSVLISRDCGRFVCVCVCWVLMGLICYYHNRIGINVQSVDHIRGSDIVAVNERYSVVMPFALLNSSEANAKSLEWIYCISNMHSDYYIYLRSTVDGLASMFRCRDKYLCGTERQPAFLNFVLLKFQMCTIPCRRCPYVLIYVQIISGDAM